MHDIKWSRPIVLQVAKKCKTRSAFKKKHSGAWRHARHHGYLTECHKLIPAGKRPNGYWHSSENIINAAKECKSRTEFKSKYSIAYAKAREQKLLDSLFRPKNPTK